MIVTPADITAVLPMKYVSRLCHERHSLISWAMRPPSLGVAAFRCQLDHDRLFLSQNLLELVQERNDRFVVNRSVQRDVRRLQKIVHGVLTAPNGFRSTSRVDQFTSFRRGPAVGRGLHPPFRT